MEGWRGYKLTGFDIIVDGLVEELCVFPEIFAQESRLPMIGVVVKPDILHHGDRFALNETWIW